LEAEQLALQTLMAHPDFYQKEQKLINDALAKLNELEKTLKVYYERWEILAAG
jgi:hypothetical protein